MRFSLPSIKFLAASPSFRPLPSAVRIMSIMLKPFMRLFTVVSQFNRTPIEEKFEVDYCNIDLLIRFNNPLFKRRMKFSKMKLNPSAELRDIVPQARGI